MTTSSWISETSFDDLIQRRETLSRRLDDGFLRIAAAEAVGRDVRGWEDFWLSILTEYELVCDAIHEATVLQAAA